MGENESGAALLDRLRATLTSYVVLPSAETADAVTLWIAATHAASMLHFAPRLAILSPEKRCGKTRLLDLLAGLVAKPLATMNASVPAVFRSLDADPPPTLILDECDALFGTKTKAEQNEDLRALINAGFMRGAPVLRCAGPTHVPTEFPSFAMCALAAIGGLPETVLDRSVIIRMRRKAPAEQVKPFRARRDGPVLDSVREDLAAWVGAHLAELGAAEPALPVEDRAADVFEALVAVADLAGGDWPARGRRSALALTGEETVEDSLGVKLLGDVKEVFQAAGNPALPSVVLVDRLRALPESPWEHFGLDQQGLGRRLRPYGVAPQQVKIDGRNVRGYRFEAFADSWSRYLAAPPLLPATPVTVQVRGSSEVAGSTPDPLPATRDHALTCGVAPVAGSSAPPARNPQAPLCRVCDEPLDVTLFTADGLRTHPGCELAGVIA